MEIVKKLVEFFKKYKTIFQVLFSAVLIYYVFSRVNIRSILKETAHIQIEWYLICLALNGYIIWGQSMRWRDLLSPKQKKTIPRRYFILLTFEGYFFNLFLPSSIGGDLVKSYKMGNLGIGKLNAGAATLLSRIFGVFVLCLFFWSGMLFFSHEVKPWLIVVMLITSVMAFGIMLSLIIQSEDRLIKRFEKLWTTIEKYRGEWKLFGVTLLKTVLLQVCILLIQYSCFRCVNIDFNLGYLLLYVPLANIITMLPVSLNGIGIREWIIIETFAKIPGVTPENCIACTMISYTFVLIHAGIGAISYILPKPASWKILEESDK